MLSMIAYTIWFGLQNMGVRCYDEILDRGDLIRDIAKRYEMKIYA